MSEPNDSHESAGQVELAASFAPYEIARVLGEGGMGVVYLARHARLDRLVALKLLSPERSGELAPRFEREARTMARLNHPNIVGFYDSGHSPDGRLFLAMEYVEGSTLAELIANPPADFDPRAITLQVCDALAYAHEQGAVHRDIKPGNVLVDARGRVKVADFGLARLADAAEQPDDPRADLSALGALIRAMCGGAKEWDAIVSRAMHADPARRFASAVEMRAAIAALAPDRAAVAQPRSRARVAVVLGLLAVLAMGAWFMRSRDEAPPRPIAPATPMPTPDPDAEWIVATRSDVPAVKADASALAALDLREGEWTSLLPHIDPARDSIRGTWEKTSGALACTKPSQWALCSIPVQEPVDDYDLRFRVTRGEGSHVAMFFLFKKNGTGGYVPIDFIDISKPAFADGRRGAGLENIGPLMYLPDGIMASRAEWLPKGRTSTVVLEVREAVVRLVVDGTEAFRWPADWSKLRQSGGSCGSLFHSLPPQPFFGVGIFNCAAVFHDIEMRLNAPAASASPASATKEAPYVNRLGMRFVPVPITGGPSAGQRVLFSVWETRVQDFRSFVERNPAPGWTPPSFAQTPNHPVVRTNLDEARAFCAWLTEVDRRAKKIGPKDRYRLPTDHEWSCAVGIGEMEDAAESPMSKHRRELKVYPWGTHLPEKTLPGNYACAELLPVASQSVPKDRLFIDHRDPFTETAPVGFFPANDLGLYDLGGNVWEWCEDWADERKELRVLRGASWAMARSLKGGFEYLLASCRFPRPPEDRLSHFGFRPVLALAPKP